jgi:positive regulator of sigma E activity
MFVFALAGLGLQQLFNLSEWPVVMMAVVGLAAGFGIVRIYSLTRARDVRQQAVVVGKPVVSPLNVFIRSSVDES